MPGWSVPAGAGSNWGGTSAATCGSTRAGPTGNAAIIRKHAAELVALAPDVILAHGTSTVGPLLQATRAVPIVFPVISDPVGVRLRRSLARPGGNATGFTTFEYGLSAKWLELLKEIAPGMTRAGGPSGCRQPLRDWPVRRDPVRGAVARGGGEPDQTCATQPKSSVASRLSRPPPSGGLIVTASALSCDSSRSDHRARSPTQTARGLFRTLLRHCGRLDLLWA